MKFPGDQKGIGITGWLFMILLFGGALTVGLKLFPVYSDHNTMSGILDGMAEEQGMALKRNNELEDMIRQRFKINNVRDFNFKDGLKIKRDSDGVSIALDYQVKLPLVSNLEMLATFHHEVDLRK